MPEAIKLFGSTKCVTKIDGKTIHDAGDLDFVMPMRNLIEYSSNYHETTESLWYYSKKLIDKTKHGENVLSLDVAEVVLVLCNLVDNQYQQNSDVLYTFAPSKSYAYLLNVESSNLAFLKTYNTEFEEITKTSTDQNGRLL